MKKISLSTVKNSMKRDEMRTIKGGCGYCGCWAYYCSASGKSSYCTYLGGCC
ncbi:hypothetical protein [Chryseobacterium shigense]|uniref:Natural product n=1 Tax=Chryseobacterium shigense TaxID=297244 RepID=A0A841N3R0_9FLAO|nr:hypothetical protein [Chryseobacterium shigense]MBB6371524.1 natural product precursor [Chryseobacterium shigense]